jgi:hypothetical protein
VILLLPEKLHEVHDTLYMTRCIEWRSAVSSLAPVVPTLRSLSRSDAASNLLGACFVLLVRDRAGVVCEA